MKAALQPERQLQQPTPSESEPPPTSDGGVTQEPPVSLLQVI